jgi:hypothetical protein
MRAHLTPGKDHKSRRQHALVSAPPHNSASRRDAKHEAQIHLRGVILSHQPSLSWNFTSSTSNAVGLVQKVFPVAQCFFCILIYRHNDRLVPSRLADLR